MRRDPASEAVRQLLKLSLSDILSSSSSRDIGLRGSVCRSELSRTGTHEKKHCPLGFVGITYRRSEFAMVVTDQVHRVYFHWLRYLVLRYIGH